MAALIHELARGDRRCRGAEAPASSRVGAEPGHRQPPAPVGEGPGLASRTPAMVMVVVIALLAVGGSLVDVVASFASTAPPSMAPAAAASPSDHPGATGARDTSVHVVQPGETYWSIAQAWGGSGDLRVRVDALRAANGSRLLRAGDHLVRPPGG